MDVERTPDFPTVDVSFAAHYVPRRVPFLVAALEAIAGWERHHARVRIVTNDPAIADEPALASVVHRLVTKGFPVDFERAHSMAHPWHLTWWHKDHLRDWSNQTGDPRDLFMYLEDDMAMTEANLDYFERYLPAAKAIGCIPSFVVYEVAPNGALIAQGFRGSQIVEDGETLVLGGQRFVAPRFPYWPGFILDRELAAQYWASPWSDRASAETMPQSRNHSCRVHSAWALAYDNVPRGLHSRYVVPVDANLDPLPECLALHAAGNYAVSKAFSFGTVPVERAFRQPGLTSAVANAGWHAQALLRRARDKALREVARLFPALGKSGH